MLTIGAQDPDDAYALQSLHSWLVRDAELSRQAQISTASSTGGYMGTADIINITLTGVTAVGNLVATFLAWRATRNGGPRFEIRIVDAQGVSPEEIERLRRMQEPPPPDGGDGPRPPDGDAA